MAQGPKGWHPGQTDTRFANVAPRSLDLKSRSVEAVLSAGADVQRVYGIERLRISPDAVVVDRLARSGIPLLDSHQQGGLANMLGTIQRVWFDAGALMGKLSFNQTPQGEMAMGMVERGEVVGISAGYKVLSWEITNEDGDIIDPDKVVVRWDDALVYTATRWELLECSLVAVGADADAMIRSGGLNIDRFIDGLNVERLNGSAYDVDGARIRMAVRQRMMQRQRMHDAQQIVFGNGDD